MTASPLPVTGDPLLGLDDDDLWVARRMLAKGDSVRDVCATTGLSQSQCYWLASQGVPEEVVEEFRAPRPVAAPVLAPPAVPGGTAKPADAPVRPSPLLLTVAVASLFLDPTYQRPTDGSRVARMAASYDPAMVGTLEVSDRGDGRFAVIDGGHRFAMLTTLGAELVGARVHSGLSVQDEAQLFQAIDRGRRALTTWDRWRARRAAGDPVVLDIDRVAAAAGWTVSVDCSRPGYVRCVRTLEVVYNLDGPDLLSRALRALREAFGSDPNAVTSELVAGVAWFVYVYGPLVDDSTLVDRLTSSTPTRWRSRAAALRETDSAEMSTLVAKTIRSSVNEVRPRDAKLAPFIARRRKPATLPRRALR